LKELCKVLQNGRDDELFNPVLLKLAGTVLPRLNEHSGPDGEKIAAVMEINYLQPEIKEVKEIKKLSPAK